MSRALHLQVCPRAHRCGFVAFTHSNGCSFRVLVLPKLWPDRTCPSVHWSAASRRLDIIAGEGSRLTLRGLPDELETCVRDGVEWLHQKAEPEEHPDQDNSDDDLDLPTRRSLKSLLTIAPSSSGDVRSFPFDTAPLPFAEGLDALLQLVMRIMSLRLPHRFIELGAAKDGSGHLVGQGRDDNPLLRLMSAHAMVEAISARKRAIRQGYRSTTSWLTTVRGSITPRGMVHVALSGEPRVECSYDDFTSSVPLFQVLVTALELVGGRAGLPPSLDDLAQDIRARARRLRRELAHIPSLPVPLAAHQAGRIRLGRLQRTWLPALEQARRLLRRESMGLTGQVKGEGGLVWHVPTADIWELVLAELLRRAGRSPRLKPPTEAPWLGQGIKSPDLLLHEGSVRLILDAKYKQPKNFKPSLEDRRQMFAYTHTAQKDATQPAWPTGGLHAVLAYPRPDQQPPRVEGEPLLRSPPLLPAPLRVDLPPVTLTSVSLPFPQPEAVASHAAWTQWLDDYASGFSSLVDTL